MRRALTWVLIAGIAALIGGAVWMRVLPHDPAQWAVDPATAERTGRPNDYRVGPGGDRDFTPVSMTARDLLFLFDSIAMNAPRTRRIAMDEAALRATYVQTSAVIGFPDYVSVTARETDQGAELLIWSRSRFGYSDMGVNRARIDRWLAQIGS